MFWVPIGGSRVILLVALLVGSLHFSVVAQAGFQTVGEGVSASREDSAVPLDRPRSVKTSAPADASFPLMEFTNALSVLARASAPAPPVVEDASEPGSPPLRPVNLLPAPGAPGVSLAPRLTLSDFSDPDAGDSHVATQWQVDDDSDFASPEFDSATDTVHLTSIRVYGGSIAPGRAHLWRARMMDSRGVWSAWSEATFFVTETADAHIVPVDFPTVQAALDGAEVGDRILVRGGRWFENIHFNGKDVTLSSLDPTDPECVAATILDGSRSGSVVRFSGTETSDCVLTGLTITNGRALHGGGIHGAATKARIERCSIRHNEAAGGPHRGGGVYGFSGWMEGNYIGSNRAIEGHGGGLYQCFGTMRSNLIERNRALRGGGLASCSPTFTANRVYDNQAWGTTGLGLGGGFYRCSGVIRNSVIRSNYASDQGGAFQECGVHVLHSIVLANSSYMGSMFMVCTGTIENCILEEAGDVTQTRQPTYCSYTDWDGVGEGNFQAEPRFVNLAAGDYRLRPDSPLIDAGTFPFTPVPEDAAGQSRPYDAVSLPRGNGWDYDIGAFEFIGEAQPNPFPNRPVNQHPMDGTTVLGFVFSMISSPFSDPDPGDRQIAAEWEISRVEDFSEIWAESGYTKDYLTSIPAIVDGKPFPADATYWWRVRHLDSYAGWSEWSLATSFTMRPEGALLSVPGDFATIQEAIDNAVDGDEIVVATGEYRVNLDFLTKNITLTSTDPLDERVVADTILRAHFQTRPAITFPDRPTSDTFGVLKGFTIYGGAMGIDCRFTKVTLERNVIKQGVILKPNGPVRNNRIEGGPGISDPGGSYCVIEGNTILSGGIQGQASFPIIRNNLISGTAGRAIVECHGLIEGNTITWNGFGAISFCNGTIRKNIIAYNTTPNSSSHRAGISFSNGTIEGNAIFGNYTLASGAGISRCDGVIRNNLVYENYAARGAAALSNCNGLIYNNTIVNNRTDTIGAGLLTCNGTIENNILWGNEAATGPQIHQSTLPEYCCIQDWEGGGVGNISVDPQFVDPENGDFRLLPTSPCIDAGAYVSEVATDFWGDPRGLDGTLEPRGDGSNFDIGADEFLGRELFNLRSDIDQSGWVDILDLLALRSDWRASPPAHPRSDFNLDELIDPSDLVILMKDWKRGTDASR